MIGDLAFVKLTWNNVEVILKICLHQLLCTENGLEVLLIVNWTLIIAFWLKYYKHFPFLLYVCL